MAFLRNLFNRGHGVAETTPPVPVRRLSHGTVCRDCYAADVTFRDDETGERLHSLWKAFVAEATEARKGAPAADAYVPDRASPSLGDFLSALVEIHVDEPVQSASDVPLPSVMGVTGGSHDVDGHPYHVVQCVCHLLAMVSGNLSSFLPANASAPPRTVLVFNAASIVSRYPYNQSVMRHHKALSHLTIAAGHLARQLEADAAEAITSVSVLLHVVATLLNLLGGSFLYLQFLDSEETGGGVVDGDDVGKGEAASREGTRPRADSNSLGVAARIVDTFVDAARVMHRISASRRLVEKEYRLMELLLSTLGCVVMERPEMRAKLFKAAGLERLIALLGWPDVLLEEGEMGGDSAPHLRYVVQEEVKVQLLTLRIVHILCNSPNKEVVARASDLHLPAKITDLVLWTYEVLFFPGNDIPSIFVGSRLSVNLTRVRATRAVSRHRGVEDFARGDGVPVTASPLAVAETMVEELISAAIARASENAGSSGATAAAKRRSVRVDSGSRTYISTKVFVSARHVASPPVTVHSVNSAVYASLFRSIGGVCMQPARDRKAHPLANRDTVEALIRVFDDDYRASPQNTRVRGKLLSDAPELQLYFLELFGRMFVGNPGAVNIAVELGLLDVLLSKYFYFAEDPHLQDSVLAFLQFTGTMHGRTNAADCKVLLSEIKKNHTSPRLVHKLCDTLRAILCARREETQEVLRLLGLPDVVAEVLGVYADAAAARADDDEVDGAWYAAVGAQDFHRARHSVLSLCDHFFADTPSVYMATADNATLLDVLFRSMFEPAVKDFGIYHVTSFMRSSTGGPPAPTVMQLYDKYLSALPSAGGAPSGLELQLDMLRAIRAVVMEAREEQQDRFRKVDVFVHLVNLINVSLDRGPEKRRKLCLEVFVTVTSLLADNAEAKEYLLETVGYDQLRSLLVLVFDSQPTRPVFGVLFDMLVDGGFAFSRDGARDERKSIVANPRVISLIFNTLFLAEHQLQLEVLDTFIGITEKATINRTYCSSMELTKLLLQRIHAESSEDVIRRLVILVELIGTHNITVQELKAIFGVLKATPGYKCALMVPLLRALQNMSTKEGPEVFFDFDGISSALVVSPFDSWPTKSGYSLHTWMRVESFIDRGGQAGRCPRVFSFCTADAQSVECFWSNRRLALQTTDKTGKAYTVVFSHVFKERTWYSVAVTHATSRVSGMLGQSDARLFVNGEQVAKAPLKYPALPGKVIGARLGSSARDPNWIPVSARAIAKHRPVPSPGPSQGGASPPLRRTVTPPPSRSPHTGVPSPRAVSYPGGDVASASPIRGVDPIGDTEATSSLVSPPFWGQLGAVYLFEDALSARQIAGVHSLGPNYVGAFVESELDEKKDPCQFLFDGELGGKVLLAFNCKASDGSTCLDNSVRSMSAETPLTATLHGLYRCVTHDLKKTIHCLGGIKVLFPLFAQLDLPPDSDKFQASPGTVVDAEGESPTLHVFLLLESMLRGSPDNQAALLECQGCAVVGYLLQKASPSHVTRRVLHVMMQLVTSTPSRELATHMYKYWFFEFRIWVFAPVEVQFDLLKFLGKCVRQDPQFFRALVGVQGILDAMREYYWYTNETASVATEPPLHPTTQQPVGKRPTLDEIASLRADLLAIMYDLIASPKAREFKTVTRGEVESIVRFLQDCQDQDQVSDVVLALLRWLTGEQSSPWQRALCAHMSNVGGVDLCLHLLSRGGSEGARIGSLKLLGVFLDNPRSDKARKKLRKEEYGFWGVVKVLAPFAPTMAEASYRALLELIVDTRSSSTPVLNAASLPCVLKVLAGGSVPVRARALAEVATLLADSAKNREEVAQQPSWALSLFALLDGVPLEGKLFGRAGAGTPHGGDGGSTTFDDEERAVSLLVSRVERSFNSVMMQLFTKTKFGWEAIEETLAALSVVSQRYSVHYYSAALLLLDGLCGALIARVQAEKAAYREAARDEETGGEEVRPFHVHETLMANICHLIVVVEEVLFCSKSADPSMGSHVFQGNIVIGATVKDDHWLGWPLAALVCDLIDVTELAGVTEWSALGVSLTNRSRLRAGGPHRVAVRLLVQGLEVGGVDVEHLTDVVRRLEGVDAAHTKQGSKAGSSQLVQLAALVRVLGSLCSKLRGGEAGEEAVGAAVAEVARAARGVISRHRDLMANTPDLRDSTGVSIVEDAALVDVTVSTDDFVAAILADPWARVRTTVLPSLEDSANAANSAAMDAMFHKRRRKTFKSVLSDLEKESLVRAACEKRSQREIAGWCAVASYAELQRRGARSAEARERLRLVIRDWRNVLRAVSNARGPWAPKGNDESSHKWKLETTENALRQRTKVERNFDYCDHKDASYRRDNSRRNNDPQPLEAGPAVKALPDDDWAVLGATLEVDGGEESDILQEVEEKEVCTSPCELVTLMTKITGRLAVTNRALYFYVDFDKLDPGTTATPDLLLNIAEDKKWELDTIREIHMRRYLFRRSAMELFLADKRNYFLNFTGGNTERNRVFSKILALKPTKLVHQGTYSPQEILKKSGLTQKWQRGAISNFEYLMHLNTIAGRSYNDISQYPVFPWVVADYTSEELDLANPATFRDLSQPMGALSETRKERLKARYEMLADPALQAHDPSGEMAIPPFHYGTHYSSGAAVLFYLVRVEPYSSLHIQLQAGKFDHADRMFHSVASCWQSCTSADSDVKELIPEFYCLPEMFTNENQFDLGKLQATGEPVEDVSLPPWAKGSPEEFVRINRAALESEYVSAHLHEWIDLIFGYKQQGEEAVEAVNVFYYLTYEGAIDMDAIEDELERQRYEDTIDNFGQTPTLLLTKPHPVRTSTRKASIFSSGQPAAYFLQAMDSSLEFIGVPSTNAMSSINMYIGVPDRIVTMDSARVMGSHRWLPLTAPGGEGPPFTFELDPGMSRSRRAGVPLAPGVHASPHCFAVTSDGNMVLSVGHWDNSLKVTHIESGKVVQSIVRHYDVVTCLAVDRNGLVTGSKDTTLCVWELAYSNGSYRVSKEPLRTLFGHDDQITCVALNMDLDVVVSASVDATVIVHTVREGRYVRSIPHPANLRVDQVAISATGHIIAYSLEDLMIHVYNINGKPLRSVDACERLSHLITTQEEEFLITASERGLINVRRLHDLSVHYRVPVQRPVCCVAMSAEEQHLLAGLSDGKLLIFANNSASTDS